MKFPILLALLPLPSSAATVNVGSLQTSFAVATIPPRLASVNQSTSITIDLSDLTGLSPGSGIDITFTTANELYWEGLFGADDGDLTLNFHCQLTLSAGAFSTSTGITWSLGPVPFEDPGSSVIGYSFGPVPTSHTLTVPWATDLSAVSLTLTDLFSLSGNNPYVVESKLQLPAATLTTSSVPEPSAAFLGILYSTALLRRRRA
jgi:hypothetical protein